MLSDIRFNGNCRFSHTGNHPLRALGAQKFLSHRCNHVQGSSEALTTATTTQHPPALTVTACTSPIPGITRTLVEGKGIMTSDQDLYADESLRGFVVKGLKQSRFVYRFGKAMVAMTIIQPTSFPVANPRELPVCQLVEIANSGFF